MASMKAATGATSSLQPAHRPQAGQLSRHALQLVSKLCSRHHPPKSLLVAASARTTKQASTQGRRPEFFSHPPLPPSLRAPSMPSPSCLADVERGIAGENASPQNFSMLNQERMAKIRKQLLKPELSPSSYDTAWVAMVPKPGSSEVPCFPQCVEWILQNQHGNGSWGLRDMGSLVNKDVLSSTLACVLALKRWNVGTEHISRGQHFIGVNFSIVTEDHIPAPVGFSITFPGMVRLAIGMGLELPVRQTDVDAILHLQKMELKRLAADKSCGSEGYMTYVAEGLGNVVDWRKNMKFQRKNGSFFNSPSTTAAALIHNYDDKAQQYLNLVVSEWSGAVPTVYPLNIYCQLSMVDSLEKTGISRHFSSEIKNILDMTYSLWLKRDEEVMLDVATCAMAFRILRMNGYDVSSDELSHVAEASAFHNSLQGYVDDTKALLELYKASEISVSENEPVLDSIGCWSGTLLTNKLCSGGVHRVPIFEEVEYALKVPFYATMERLDHRRNIEHFDDMGYQMLKTAYLPCRVNKDHLAFAVEDFTFSQLVYQDELRHLESWFKGDGLDRLQFARLKLTYSYLSGCATIFPPELSDARIAWTQNCVLTPICDDFFDFAGSKEELENLLELVEKWDEHNKIQFCSERVRILFCSMYSTVNQLGEKASVVQNRDVRKHMIELWLNTLRSMMTEAEWARSQYVPTIDEYIMNANISYALGPIVPLSLYFLGQELSESVVKDQEYTELFRLMNTSCRLLNDVQTFEREGSQGKLNSVWLLVHYSGGSMSTEEAVKAIEESIASCRRDLLRLVLKEDSVVPRPCKELFWKMCKINHLFYGQSDGYSSPTEMVGAGNAVIYEPLRLQISDPSLDVKSK